MQSSLSSVVVATLLWIASLNSRMSFSTHSAMSGAGLMHKPLRKGNLLILLLAIVMGSIAALMARGVLGDLFKEGRRATVQRNELTEPLSALLDGWRERDCLVRPWPDRLCILQGRPRQEPVPIPMPPPEPQHPCMVPPLSCL